MGASGFSRYRAAFTERGSVIAAAATGRTSVPTESGRTLAGLTTAASIWLVAAIGIAVAIGQWPLALMGTALALIVLIALGWVERRIGKTFDKPK